MGEAAKDIFDLLSLSGSCYIKHLQHEYFNKKKQL